MRVGAEGPAEGSQASIGGGCGGGRTRTLQRAFKLQPGNLIISLYLARARKDTEAWIRHPSLPPLPQHPSGGAWNFRKKCTLRTRPGTVKIGENNTPFCSDSRGLQK